MTIARFFTKPIGITTPSASVDDTTTDADGLPIVGNGSPVTVNGHVQPYRALEGQVALPAEFATGAKHVWVPAGTTVSHLSKLTIDGLYYDVYGDADDWDVGSLNDHVELFATRTAR